MIQLVSSIFYIFHIFKTLKESYLCVNRFCSRPGSVLFTSDLDPIYLYIKFLATDGVISILCMMHCIMHFCHSSENLSHDHIITLPRKLLFISYKFVKGFLAITFLLLVISNWNFHDVCQSLYNQEHNFSWIGQNTKIFPIDPHYKNSQLL